ncbi:MAG: non-ribosomal peptide synthetase, partial [Chitinophagaceae bacterium]|nr:non-ribosomal peptide synthetase [Chitinophagaceae bacterium]
MNSVIDLFNRIVLERANNIAVYSDEKSITYAELNGMSERVAYYLAQHELGRDAVVAIILERSVEMIAAILGVIRSGATYLIIDSKYPAKRVEYMLHDSGCTHLITDNKFKNTLAYEFSGTSLFMEFALRSPQLVLHDVPITQNPLLYIIYTSGSTGTPKGVMVEHRGVVNMALSYIDRFQLSADDRILQFASMSFAASVIEIYIALLSGGALYIIPDTKKMNHQLFKDYLFHHSVSLALLPPNYISGLNPENIKLRILITAGSPTNWNIVDMWSRHLSYYNVYGCSETSTGVSAYKADFNAKRTRNVPIGEPNPNTEFFILNENDEPIAEGEVGELCVAGICLARGYLNKPELTEEKFISYENKNITTRIYRTGDFARLNETGEVEIVGRIDDQVKINGYRIELGEINNIITELVGVKDSTVVSIKIGNSETLCAYCVLSSDNVIPVIRKHLEERLPEYMIPRFVMSIDAIPLNINGKVDKSALPLPTGNETGNIGVCSPRNAFESLLFTIWSDLLGVNSESLSVFDNYFLLGGDSVIAIQMVSMLYKAG